MAGDGGNLELDSDHQHKSEFIVIMGNQYKIVMMMIMMMMMIIIIIIVVIIIVIIIVIVIMIVIVVLSTVSLAIPLLTSPDPVLLPLRKPLVLERGPAGSRPG